METDLRILYLEDNPSDAELAQDTLASAGFDCDVLRVETRKDFETALTKGGFDLILSDKTLPQYDGLSALALAREKRPEVPFIFVSGTMGEEAAIESLKNGASDYVLKQRLARLVPVTRLALREAAERSVREKSEAERKRLSTAVEYAAEAVFITDVAGTIQYVNPAFERITGYSSAEAIGQNPRILQSGEQDEAFYRAMWDTLTRGQVWQASLVNRKRDGTTYRVEETISPVLDAEGHIVNYVAVQHDITERLRAEEALAASEAELRDLFAAMTDIVLVLDSEGRYLQIAPTNPALLVKPPAELRGRTLHEVMPETDADNILRSIRRALEQQQPIQVEYGLTIAGATLWFDGTVSPMGADKVFWIARDVTERKHVEQRLLLSDQILQRITSLVVVADAQGQIIYVSPSVKQILGFEPAEALGEGWWRLTRPDTEFGAQERAQLVLAARGEIPVSAEPYERELTDRDGKPHWLLWQDTRGPGQIVIGVGHDITERKQAEEALRQSEEKYRYLFERNPNPMWVYDLETLAFLAVNEAAIRQYGYARAEFMRMTLTDIRPLEDVPALLANVAELQPGLTRTVDWQHRLNDGRLIDVEITSQPITFEGRQARLVLAVDVSERKRAETQIQQHVQHLAALRSIDQAISSSLDLRMTLNVLLAQVVEQLHVHAAAVLLLNSSTLMLEFAAGRGFRSRVIERAHLRLGDSIAGRAALERRVIAVPDLGSVELPPELAEMLRAENFASYVGAPLIAKGQVKGILEIWQRQPLDPDPEWLNFFEALAAQAAIAIDNSQLFDRLQRSNLDLTLAYDTTIEGWSRALDLRDKETEGHTQRVTEKTLYLARQLGLPEEQLVHIRRGALLHDIGKMGVPDSILLKPGPLTSEEWSVMQQHPALAYELLSPIAYLRPALDIPYCHHEKWDGTGYPRGLKGEQIPMTARIFSVVDVWDALRSDRPYRAAWPEERVRAHIQCLSGTHFDPKVAEHFLSLA